MQNWCEKLPPQVVGRARTLGPEGQQWLQQLNESIAQLEDLWNVRVTEVLSGGSHAFIGCAVNDGGDAFILKMELPDYPLEAFLEGVNMLKRARGKGYCRLIAVDASRRAALLERLGEPLGCSGKNAQEQMRILCAAMLDTWSIPLTQAEEGRSNANYHWFKSYIPSTWEAEPTLCSRRVVDAALRYTNWLEKRTQPQGYVWVHGDAHANNMLRVPGTDSYKLIDPDGKVFEKSYDVGVLMREWPEDYQPDPMTKGRERSRFLSELTGVPAEDIWAWGFLQMAATAMILHQIGQEELSRTMLSIAEKWA